LSLEAVDLIDKLMQLVPEERLGAGEPGSDTDYEHLKNHPFFKGINFKRLHHTAPPVPVERFQNVFAKGKAKTNPALNLKR
jgi:hypothetical protein